MSPRSSAKRGSSTSNRGLGVTAPAGIADDDWIQSGFPNFPSCQQPGTHLILLPVNKTPSSCKIVEGHCAGPTVCPLSQVKAGTVVNVKHLALAPEMSDRLRELGLGEEQQVKLLSREANVICLVCNARVALSEELAEAILVEPVVPKP